MYIQSIETDRNKMKSHNEANAKMASDRALSRLDYNKKHPKKGTK